MVKKSRAEVGASTGPDDSVWLRVIGKALAYQCLCSSEMKNETMGEQARFLVALGLPRKDIAAMLSTTENSVSAQLAKKKKTRKKPKSAGSGK